MFKSLFIVLVLATLINQANAGPFFCITCTAALTLAAAATGGTIFLSGGGEAWAAKCVALCFAPTP